MFGVTWKPLQYAFTLFFVLVLFLSLFLSLALWPLPAPKLSYPGGATFALAICDDTDGATLENIRPVYDFLFEQGIRSTKTVWVYSADRSDYSYSNGDSLEREDYRDYIRELQRRDFEIALHGVRGSSSSRRIIMEGIEEFRATFGGYPSIHINHRANRDNLYWGSKRLTIPLFRWLHGLALSVDNYEGEIPDSQYFWGDIAQSHVSYVNDLSFLELDLSKIGSSISYYDAGKAYVDGWFHTSDGNDVESFNALLSDENLNEIESRGGYSIVYTHFGKRFFLDGKLNGTFVHRIEALVARNVWITTTSELLEFLEEQRKNDERSSWDRFRVELRWILEKLYYGPS